jgi:hypothetical protein
VADPESVSFGARPAAKATFGPAAERTLYSRTSEDLPPGDSPRPGTPAGAMKAGDSGELQAPSEEGELIRRAQQIYNASTSYITANVANSWERNLAHFHSEHAPGTHYRKLGFKRSRMFRPMTRANVKSQEASASSAIFSTKEMLVVSAQNPKDMKQQEAAKVIKFLLQYRLEDRMPWFQTVMGAYQDTKVYGVCVTHQYWDYHEDTDVVPAFDEETGEPITNEKGESMGRQVTRVRRDALACDNVPPENFRFDPTCDWRDPARTSPWLVYMKPMPANDALEMMEKVDPKTQQPVWRRYTLERILSTRKNAYDNTRQAREGQSRVDTAATAKEAGSEYTTVWAHLNIIRINGDDIAYWTMGTELLLTEPKLLRELYPWLEEGERPFVIGTSTIETHRNYPEGDVGQGAPLQEELNTVVNQRMDNVKLVLNKRYHVRRGSQTDLDALMRNVPGGGVMMNDPEKDVKIVDTPDVTQSGYQEQDRIQIEFDNLVGNMSAASVMSNRKMGETVGGMSMLGQSANAVQDYGIIIFLTTWMRPTIGQLMRLEQMYENDTVLLALAGEASGYFQRFNTDKLTDELLLQKLTATIDVGMGNTDPVRRVERLAYGIEKVAELPGIAPRLKSVHIADQVFGALGYRDSSGFVMTDEEWQQHIEENPPEPPPEIAVKMRELDIREATEQARDARETYRITEEMKLQYARLAFDYDKSIDQVLAAMSSDKLNDKTKRDVAALQAAQKAEELNMKRAQGPGISPSGGKPKGKESKPAGGKKE